MSLIVNRKATCPKCGDTNQTYSYYATWNSVFGDHAPQIKNFCTKCGTEIHYKDSGEVIYGTAGRNIDFLFKEKPWEKRMMN